MKGIFICHSCEPTQFNGKQKHWPYWFHSKFAYFSLHIPQLNLNAINQVKKKTVNNEQTHEYENKYVRWNKYNVLFKSFPHLNWKWSMMHLRIYYGFCTFSMIFNWTLLFFRMKFNLKLWENGFICWSKWILGIKM